MQIIALNVHKNETQKIDQGYFESKPNHIPGFINYSPNQIAISDNYIVYCANLPGKSISSEVICYDLDENNKKVIQKTEDVTKEWLHDCSIYGNNIVWSKFIELNDSFSYRMSNYKYSNLYLYNIISGEIDQLTDEGDFYCSSSLYKDKLTMIKVPLTKQGQTSSNTEVAIMDIRSKKIEVIVDENSPTYSRVEDLLFRSDPIINSKYVSWQNCGFDNRYLYDYHKKVFVKVYNKNGSDPINNPTVIYKLLDDAVLIYENKANGNSKNLYVSLY